MFRAVLRDGLIAAGCLLLVLHGSLMLLAAAFGYADGWKAWAMPLTGVAFYLLAARMVQVRVGRERRIRRAGHRRAAWSVRGR